MGLLEVCLLACLPVRLLVCLSVIISTDLTLRCRMHSSSVQCSKSPATCY
jgi:hypothetical protein